MCVFLRSGRFLRVFVCFSALGVPLGSLGALLGALGTLLAALGPLWGALRPLLERHAKMTPKSMPKITDLDHPQAPQMAPKSTPKSIKNKRKKRFEERIDIEPT